MPVSSHTNVTCPLPGSVRQATADALDHVIEAAVGAGREDIAGSGEDGEASAWCGGGASTKWKDFPAMLSGSDEIWPADAYYERHILDQAPSSSLTTQCQMKPSTLICFPPAAPNYKKSSVHPSRDTVYKPGHLDFLSFFFGCTPRVLYTRHI